MEYIILVMKSTLIVGLALNQSDISYDPCNGRSGSLTNSSLTVTFHSTTAGTITGGDYIELAEVAFTASGAGLIGR